MSTKRFGVETSKTLGVRLPLEELALIEGAAAGAGQKPGVWAREVLLKAAAPDKPEWLGAPCPGCSKPIEVVVIGPDGTTCWDCFRRLEAASNEIAGGEPGGPRPTGHLSPSAPGDDPPANRLDVLYGKPMANPDGMGWTCNACERNFWIARGKILEPESGVPVEPCEHLRFALGLRPGWATVWAALERMEPAAGIARLNELRAGRELPDGFRDWPKAGKISWLDRHWPL